LAPLKYRLEAKQSVRSNNSNYDYTTEANPEQQLNSDSNMSSLIELKDIKVLNGKLFNNLEIIDPSFDVAYYIHVDEDIPTNEYRTTGYKFGIPLIGAVILFICNFCKYTKN
jgi:hypothetical protein